MCFKNHVFFFVKSRETMVKIYSGTLFFGDTNMVGIGIVLKCVLKSYYYHVMTHGILVYFVFVYYVPSHKVKIERIFVPHTWTSLDGPKLRKE